MSSQIPTPIRVALIGLSASATTSWASQGHLPYLLSPTGKRYYQITALCNSSVQAAQAAIKTYNLSQDTKAYGSPDDLASDKEVDMVICCTRVDKHIETILPSLKVGQVVFVEWPIASNLDDISKIQKANEQAGSKPVLVGLQGRFAPPVVKVKDIIQSGRLGKVLSSNVTVFGGSIDRNILPTGLKYFAQREIGGNPVTIGFAHMVDWIQSVLGDLKPETTQSHMQLQRPDVKIRDPATGSIVETFRSNVPDLISIQGTLPESSEVVKSATLTVFFRRGQPFVGEPSFTWKINCEKGEIRLVAPGGAMLQADSYSQPVTIHVHDFAKDRLEEEEWDWESWQEESPIRGRSIAKVLQNFAQGIDNGWPSLDSAAERAVQIDSWLKEWLSA